MDGAFVIKGMAYRVYILQSDRDGSFYIGHAADLTERLRRHNEGRSWYTKAKIPWRVVYQEEYLAGNLTHFPSSFFFLIPAIFPVEQNPFLF
jgi:hypothetical protein